MKLFIGSLGVKNLILGGTHVFFVMTTQGHVS